MHLELASNNGQSTPGGQISPDSPLAMRGLTVSYGEKPAVFSVDASFAAGAMTAIIGPNGAGKSTLLKAALGIVKPLSGRVSCYGAPISKQRHRIAYVPQRASVDWDFPTRVIDVVLMGLYRELGLLRRVRARHIEQALACLRPRRHGRLRRPPDRPAVRRPAAARVPCARAGAGRRSLPAGRALRRRRCRHRKGHHRCAERAEAPRARPWSPCITTWPPCRTTSTTSS